MKLARLHPYARSLKLATFWLLIASCTAATARAGGFAISLDVSDGTRQRAATQPSSRLRSPLTLRPLFKAAAIAHFVASCKVARTSKLAASDVLVHFYVVKLERSGQAPPPLAPDRVIIEGAWTMDFEPGESSRATLPFRIDKPGVYLVRLETSPSSTPAAVEDFAEMELLIK